MLRLRSGNGLHSKTNASATRVPTSFLMARWMSAYGSSCPNPHLCVICTRSTPLRRENCSALFCPPSKSLNSPCGGSQMPESFREWAREVPDGFVFSVKGPRFATNRRVLAEAGDSIKRFYDSGVLELGDRLGPVLWQFAPTKKFVEADFGKFLELLPRKLDGRAPRHVVA